MNTEDIYKLFAFLRKEHIEKIFKQIDIQTNYDEESLTLLEKQIDCIFPFGQKPYDEAIIPFGFYFGETIIKNIPDARWIIEEATSLYDVKVVYEVEEGYSIIYPFTRIKNYWIDRSKGIAALFRVINLTSLKFINADNISEGNTLTFTNGDTLTALNRDSFKSPGIR